MKANRGLQRRGFGNSLVPREAPPPGAWCTVAPLEPYHWMGHEAMSGAIDGWSYSAAQARAILDNVVDGIITMGPDGIVRGFNRAAQRMFEYAPEEIIGQPVSLLMPAPHAERHAGYVEHYLKTGIKRIIGIGRELEGMTRSGRIFPIYLAVSEVTVDGERTFTGVVRDLSRQRQAEAQIRSQQERLAYLDRLSTLGEMTAGIAHEINQPLTAIALYAQSCRRLLEADDLDKAKLMAVLDKLSEQSLRAGSVIEGIQRLVSSQSPEPVPTNLNTLITDVATLAYADARGNAAELRFDLAAGLPPVRCDRVQIQQVILNLIRNAIDAMIEVGFRYGRSVVLRTRPEVVRVIVEVEDHGGGVTRLSEDELFAPFKTTKESGMGMGLSICRTIVDNHGGEIGFTNKTDGTGAVFRFHLPVTRA